MKAGTGFFLCIGFGIGISFAHGNSWIWQGILSAFIIFVLHILTKSEHVKDTINNCKERSVNFSLSKYFLINMFSNIVVIFSTFFIVYLLKLNFA